MYFSPTHEPFRHFYTFRTYTKARKRPRAIVFRNWITYIFRVRRRRRAVRAFSSCGTNYDEKSQIPFTVLIVGRYFPLPPLFSRTYKSFDLVPTVSLTFFPHLLVCNRNAARLNRFDVRIFGQRRRSDGGVAGANARSEPSTRYRIVVKMGNGKTFV